MNLTWQIVKKDARRLKWSLALWLALVAAELSIGVWLAPAPDNLAEELKSIACLHDTLVGLQALLCCIITARLVQEDPASDPGAFWPTRPISRRRLLGAKLLGLVTLLWLLSLALLIPWWISSGFGLGDMADAALDTVFWQAVITLPAMALASVTPNLARFLMWGFVAAVTMTALTITGDGRQDAWDAMKGTFANWTMVSHEMVRIKDQELRFLATGLEMLLIGILATLYQYRTGHVRRAIGILCCAGVVGPLGAWLLPWNIGTVLTFTFFPEGIPEAQFSPADRQFLYQQAHRMAPIEKFDGFDVKLAATLTSTKEDWDDDSGSGATMHFTHSIPIRFEHVPPFEWVEQQQASIVLEPGGDISPLLPGTNLVQPGWRPQLWLWPPLSTYIGGYSTPVESPSNFLVFQGAPLKLPLPTMATVHLKLSVLRYVQTAEAPLRVGAHGAHSAARFKILSLEPSRPNQRSPWPTVVFANLQPAGSLIARLVNPSRSVSDFWSLEYLLLNRTHSRPEGIKGYEPGGFRAGAIQQMRIGGVLIELHQIDFSDQASSNGLSELAQPDFSLGSWLAAPPDAKWLEGASILLFEKEYLGAFERDATATNLELRDKTKDPMPVPIP